MSESDDNRRPPWEMRTPRIPAPIYPPVDLRPRHDWAKILTLIIGFSGLAITLATVFIAYGRQEAQVARIQRIEDRQIQQQDDITSTRYESKSANAGVQRVEVKVDELAKDLNDQLRRINITGRNR